MTALTQRRIAGTNMTVLRVDEGNPVMFARATRGRLDVDVTSV